MNCDMNMFSGKLEANVVASIHHFRNLGMFCNCMRQFMQHPNVMVGGYIAV